MEPTDLTETISTAAAKPAKAASDGQSVDARPLAELIEADRYLAEKAARSSPKRGLRFNKLVPPGA